MTFDPLRQALRHLVLALSSCSPCGTGSDATRTARSGAPYHAFDIYSMVAMTTAEEWKQGEELREQYRDTDPLPEAQAIVRELFADLHAPGTLLLREHARTVGYLVPEKNVEGFIADVRELIVGEE